MYTTYLIAATICVVFASMSYPSSASEDFDATPKGSYVIVKLDRATYKMTPNGVKPGLADIS